jgi:hypothetical protein
MSYNCDLCEKLVNKWIEVWIHSPEKKSVGMITLVIIFVAKIV